MTSKPDYILHTADESQVTVDWFFGSAPASLKARQFVLIVVSWIFVALPIVLTSSALLHRDDQDSTWARYPEWFDIWQRTMAVMGVVICVFAVGFLVAFFWNRAATRTLNQSRTYDDERLARRLEIASDWYTSKYGDAALRVLPMSIRVEPHDNIGTYELRELYEERESD